MVDIGKQITFWRESAKEDWGCGPTTCAEWTDNRIEPIPGGERQWLEVMQAPSLK